MYSIFRLSKKIVVLIIVLLAFRMPNLLAQGVVNDTTSVNETTKEVLKNTAAVKDSSALSQLSAEQTYKSLPPPYGANLFDGKANMGGSTGVNPTYLIVIGDRIQIKIWGALQADQTVVVDPKGNIFIPEVGPVQVAGVPSSELQVVVTNAVKQVYFDNVEVYASLLSVNNITIFVTGAVRHPGQYSGLSNDSPLSFLQKAGGVDATRGSYRKINIVRDNSIVETVDLYAFLEGGYLPAHRFQDGDTIVVNPQGETVSVQGVTRSPFQFEFLNNPNGQEISQYARPRSNVTHVAVKGSRPTGPFSTYIPYNEFLTYQFSDGDEIRFEADAQIQSIDITIEGSHQGPSFYSFKRDATLQEALDYIPVDVREADVQSIYIKRKSVAQQQQRMLDDALKRLEQSVLTAPASSDGEASIRAKEAEMVRQFVQQAKTTKAEGIIVVSETGKAANIRLEDSDVIVIPRKTDVVAIGGEVVMPQTVVYMQEAVLGDYLLKAGGLTERADAKRIIIMKPNGSVHMNPKIPIKAGDQIMVMPKVDAKNMQFTKDITQIIYQIAVAAKVATGL